MSFEVFVLGCGGMAPLPYRHLTSALVRREGDLFLFDGGEGTQVSLRRLNLRWKKINAVFVSHTHADHVTGLPGILMLSSQVERDEPLYIYGPPKIAEYIETSRRVLDMYINYEIVVGEIRAPGVIYEGDGFRIRAFALDHTKPCFGYALEEDSRPGVFYPEKALAAGVPRGALWAALQSGKSVKNENDQIVSPDQVLGPRRSGRTVAVVTDTLYLDTIAPEVYRSDLLLCEGMFESALLAQAREKKHMTAVQAAQIARAAEVKKLGLIHYSPRYTDSELKRLLAEAREIFPAAELTRDRMVFPIAYED